MEYKHGIYTESISAAGSLQTRAVGTVPVYIGTAPIHKTTGTENKVNTPILINSYNDFVEKVGYSDNWDSFTLCEAAYAHFKNGIQAIAPFIVVNMLDNTKHITDKTTASVTFTNKVGYLSNPNDDIVISSLESEDLGTDFVAVYTSDNRVKITYTGASAVTTVTVSYVKSDISKIDGDSFNKAINAIDNATVVLGVTPNIIVAPKYSSIYKDVIIDKCVSRISGKWACVGYIDIPTDSVTSIEAAKTYKATNGITCKYVRLHYPKAKYSGRVFHLSVLDAVVTQITDNETDGVSCRSSSNKRISCDVPVLNATTAMVYSESSANKLNEKGITTINYIGGSYRLWGGHMANYDYASIASIEAQDRSDATIRMQIYLDNWLKREFVENIDAPLTRREIDNLLSSINIGLNSFVNSGYLLKGDCYFDEGNNVTAELADGNLVLDVLHTQTPNGKSISFKLQYDVSGLETLYATGEV